MKRRYPYHIVLVLSLMLILAAGEIYCQEGRVTTNRVGLVINNLPDTIAPTITLVTPPIGTAEIYVTDKESIDLVGEVKDESDLKMVSLNSQLIPLNEYGLFTSSIKLEPGDNPLKIVAMDDRDNVREHVVVIQYAPPVLTLSERITRNSTYYALLIGINDYEDEGIQDLERPINDAISFKEILTREYTFDEENVVIMKDPKRRDLIQELDRLRGIVTPEDNLLIFYAGHGYWDEEGRIGYWLPSDAARGSTVEWFRNSTLVDYLQVIQSKHTLLITDACFAGSIFKARAANMDMGVAYEKIYDLRSRKAMTSGTLTEVPDESAFITYLLKRLEENTETYLSSEELFTRIKMAVISNSNAVPQYGDIQNVGNEGGDFIFLRRDQ